MSRQKVSYIAPGQTRHKLSGTTAEGYLLWLVVVWNVELAVVAAVKNLLPRHDLSSRSVASFILKISSLHVSSHRSSVKIISEITHIMDQSTS